MAILKRVAIGVLSFTFIVFVVLFGRLPIFRKTPIGFLHRLLLIHTPHLLSSLDAKITNGRISRSLRRSEHYLLNDPHPLVLIFFLCILVGSASLFVPAAWSSLPLTHRLLLSLMITMPYIFLYQGVYRTSFLTPSNHNKAMSHYPFDRVIFHPGQICRTCKHQKPARSKHCSICGMCVTKHDHHCVWLNNCVGRQNYFSFLGLLLSLSVLLAYATWLGYGILDTQLQSHFVPERLIRGSTSSKHWATKLSWSGYFQYWSFAMSSNVRVGAISLLAVLSFPLSTGLLIYHIHLIWAGMTTNESSKWADLRDDIDQGIVWKALRSEILDDYPPLEESIEPRIYEWPAQSNWTVCRIRQGGRPHYWKRRASDAANGVRRDTGVVDPRWKQVTSLAEIVNVYDLGFWSNLQDIWVNRK